VHDATLHGLRHNVASFLVVLQAQPRLGHADAATTLREYAYALPLTDARVADALEQHLCDWPSRICPATTGKRTRQRTPVVGDERVGAEAQAQAASSAKRSGQTATVRSPSATWGIMEPCLQRRAILSASLSTQRSATANRPCAAPA
jgi:hypothetical protein